MRNLVWLASYPKSGNTWLRLFLHAYLANNTGINCMGGPGETGDMQKAFYQLACPPQYRKVRDWPRFWRHRWDSTRVPLEDIPADDTIYLRMAALYAMTRLEGDQFVKTHCARRVLEGVDLIPPGLTKGAIYVIRDPRDVAISFAHHLGATVDEAIDLMAKSATLTDGNLGQYLGSWSEHVDSWRRTPFPTLIARYEDMLSGEAWPHIAKFVREDVDENRMQAAIDATQADKLQAEERVTAFRERSPKADRFFRECRSTWEEVLTGPQVIRIEEAHHEAMQRFGYTLETDAAAA